MISKLISNKYWQVGTPYEYDDKLGFWGSLTSNKRSRHIAHQWKLDEEDFYYRSSCGLEVSPGMINSNSNMFKRKCKKCEKVYVGK
jgi:hypothetical protein